MAAEYFILKKGQLEGPYPEEEVARRIGEGTLTGGDLGRTSESYYWMPLRRLLGDSAEAAPAATAPAFGVFLEDIRERAWIAFLHYPWEAGLFCLAVGLAVALLTFWPILLYGPFLLASIMAGAMLFLRGRTAAGIGMCVTAVLLPIIIVLLLKP